MALFTQDNLLIPLCAEATDVNPNVELDCFSMAKYNHATVVIMFSAALTGDNVLTVESGATDGADTADITFHYRLNSAVAGSAGADVLAADATAATLTLTAATYQGKMLVLEIDADELRTSGETVYDFVTVDLDGAADVGTIAAFAILSKPRYAEAIMDTAIPTS